MRPNRTPVLGDVFAFADALTVPVRLRLAALLEAPGRAPALLPGQLTSAPLPADRDGRTAVRSAIEAGFDRQTLVALEPNRLDAVVPALTHCDQSAVSRGLPSRIRAPLARQLGGAQLGELTIGRIAGWPGFGPNRVSLLVGAVVGVALDAAGPGRPVAGRRRRQVPVADLPNPCRGFLDEALAAGGDIRDRGVFENDVLPLGPSMTRQELARALGIGPEQVRRVGARAAGRVDAVLTHAPCAVRELASAVADQLGAAAPRTAVDGILASFGLPALPDSRSRLLLWLSGPYREVEGHPGWVVLDNSGLVAETGRLIHEDGGVRPVEHVVRELHLVGVAAEHAEDWLARQPIRVSEGLVVATTGAFADVAERALQARGRAMTVDEMAGWVPAGRRGIEALWSAPDRRFLVTEGDRLALAEWGDSPEEASA